MLTEAKKPKKREAKPKVEKSVQDTIDPNTGQPVEVTKPAKAMTGNPANVIVVYPNTNGQVSPVDPRNPMRNSQTALLQAHTEKPGMLLREYIDYARGKIVQGIGQSEIPKPPSQGDNGNEPMNDDKSGDLGNDTKAPTGEGKFGSADERIRKRAGKRNQYHNGIPGVWGGDNADYE